MHNIGSMLTRNNIVHTVRIECESNHTYTFLFHFAGIYVCPPTFALRSPITPVQCYLYLHLSEMPLVHILERSSELWYLSVMRRNISATFEFPEVRPTRVMIFFQFLFMRKPTPGCQLFTSVEWQNKYAAEW